MLHAGTTKELRGNKKSRNRFQARHESIRPLCFEEYNNLAMVENPDDEKVMYAARLGGAVALGKPEFASLCVQCRECVDKCPQHIDIPAVLESVVEELEGPGFEERVAMARQLFRQK